MFEKKIVSIFNKYIYFFVLCQYNLNRYFNVYLYVLGLNEKEEINDDADSEFICEEKLDLFNKENNELKNDNYEKIIRTNNEDNCNEVIDEIENNLNQQIQIEENDNDNFDETLIIIEPRYREVKKYKCVNGKYTCWDCGKIYKSNTSLSRHRAVDCGPKNKRTYYCQSCNYATAYKGNYDRHLKAPKHFTNPNLFINTTSKNNQRKKRYEN